MLEMVDSWAVELSPRAAEWNLFMFRSNDLYLTPDPETPRLQFSCIQTTRASKKGIQIVAY